MGPPTECRNSWKVASEQSCFRTSSQVGPVRQTGSQEKKQLPAWLVVWTGSSRLQEDEGGAGEAPGGCLCWREAGMMKSRAGHRQAPPQRTITSAKEEQAQEGRGTPVSRAFCGLVPKVAAPSQVPHGNCGHEDLNICSWTHLGEPGVSKSLKHVDPCSLPAEMNPGVQPKVLVGETETSSFLQGVGGSWNRKAWEL